MSGYIVKFCPHCGKYLSSGMGSTNTSKIGETHYYTCPHCGGTITNGKKPWEEMNSVQKGSELIRYLFTTFWVSVCGGLLISYGCSSTTQSDDSIISTLIISSVVLWILFIILFFTRYTSKK